MEPDVSIKTDMEMSDKRKINNTAITPYTKRVVLEFLKKNGCNRATLETTAKSRRQNSQQIIDFICQSYENAELNVNQEYHSVSLSNINQWLELLKEADLSNLCEFEAAAVVNAIVCNEPQPKPEELGGINMSEVYGFLENALTGQPQKKLSEASEAFLFREINLLIGEANSELSDKVAHNMRTNLLFRQDYDFEADPNKCSLDPLFLDE